MSTNLPVSWQEELARSAREVAERERPGLSTISLKAGIMKLGDVPVPGNKMEAIIIASVFENAYFPNRYDPEKRENPACFSLSVTGDDMVPAEESDDKQHATCEGCPNMEWGSSPTGGRGKACKEKRRLALLPRDCLERGNIKSAEMALLSVPVTSAKNWANYVNQLAAEYERPPWAVVTEVSVHPNAKSQFEVKFRTSAIISDESHLGEVHNRIEFARGVLLTPYEKNEAEEAAPAAKPRKGKY